MKIAKMILLTLVLCCSAWAQQGATPNVTPLVLPQGSNTGEVTGNLSEGRKVDLNWAAQSSVAAFPGTRFEMFDGNQVFYRIALPAASQITLTLTPETGKLINMFALRQGPNETATPPNITSAISAEAKYPIYANMGGGRKVSNKDDGIRKIEFMSVNNPYSILIGVAGAQGLTEGAYTLNITISGR